MNTRMITLFIFLWFFGCLTVWSQENLKIEGFIIDQSTQVPIAFAHIGIPSLGIGTVSNNDGQFSFIFPKEYISEKIVISHIGYFDLSIDYSKLKMDEANNFFLRPNAVVLQGVEVLETEFPLNYYIEKAIKNLKKNYPSKLHFMSGFFREAKINGETKNYDRLLEAAIDIQDKGLKTSRENIRIQVNEIRKSNDFSDYSELNKRLEKQFGGRNKIYDLFTRNPIRQFLNEKNATSLKYNLLQLMRNNEDELSLKDVLYKNKTKIYVINYNGFIFSGTLFIDNQDYGIHRLELVTDNGKLFTSEQKAKMNPKFEKDRPSDHSIYLYQKINGQYHLNLIRKTTFDGFLNSKNKDYDRIYSYAIRTLMINNFYVNKKEFDRIKLKQMEKKDINAYDIQIPYNEIFWKNYNILTLEPLNSEIQNDLEWQTKLEAQFKANGKKN